jgi:hypothetical protein
MPLRDTHVPGHPTGEEGGVSRRTVLTGAGVAVTGGVALGALGPAAAEAGTPAGIGTGPRGSTAVEFRGRIAQTGPTGESFTSYGFIYEVRGAPSSALFSGTPTSAATALLTVYATGALVARVLDQSVHALDIDGTMTVYQRSAPGADFSDPSSFAVGTAVATFVVTIQDVLTVFAPGKGLPTITGDMRQTSAKLLSGGLSGRRFGFQGQRLRMLATGLGTLVDPATLNSLHEVAGSWTVE